MGLRFGNKKFPEGASSLRPFVFGSNVYIHATFCEMPQTINEVHHSRGHIETKDITGKAKPRKEGKKCLN